MSLADELAAAGGVQAPPQATARLKDLLGDTLRHGADELGRKRSGTREDPVTVAFAADGERLLAAVPASPALRADIDALPDRAWLLVAAVVGALVELAAPPRAHRAPRGSSCASGRRPATRCWAIRRPPSSRPSSRSSRRSPSRTTRRASTACARTRSRVPAVVLGDVALREPIGSHHPLRVAEAVARLGGRPAESGSVEDHEEAVLALLGAREGPARAHEDPDPARRVARRILQRLDGMGKWGGYHTDFTHLARGFAGNDRQLASEVGEALLAAGLLAEKPSVGQRHVFLNPRRAGDIRRLIETGEEPGGLSLARK